MNGTQLFVNFNLGCFSIVQATSQTMQMFQFHQRRLQLFLQMASIYKTNNVVFKTVNI